MPKEYKYLILIEVATNDGDLSQRISGITEKDFNIIKPLIDEIKNFKPYIVKSKTGCSFTHAHNYNMPPRVRDDLGEKNPEDIYSDIDQEVFEKFNSFTPSRDFHSITKIVIFPFVDGVQLL